MRRSRRFAWPCRACCTKRAWRAGPSAMCRAAATELEQLLAAHPLLSRPRPAVVRRRSGQSRPAVARRRCGWCAPGRQRACACWAITICTCWRWRSPARSCARTIRSSEILAAPDRDALLEWLLQRPLAHYEPAHRDLLVHAGVVPQWSCRADAGTGARGAAARCSSDAARAAVADVRRSARSLASRRLQASSACASRSTCSRGCASARADGRIDLQQKGKPDSAPTPWMPWFKAPRARQRGAAHHLRPLVGAGILSRAGPARPRHRLRLGRSADRASISMTRELRPVSVPSRQPRSIEA